MDSHNFFSLTIIMNTYQKRINIMINEVDAPFVCRKCEKLTVFYVADLRKDLKCECSHLLHKGSGSKIDKIEKQYDEIVRLLDKILLH